MISFNLQEQDGRYAVVAGTALSFGAGSQDALVPLE